jgi:phosphatidylserine/phosphatidylglycerophosphate/cardiolipin synthase-like enzyme
MSDEQIPDIDHEALKGLDAAARSLAAPYEALRQAAQTVMPSLAALDELRAATAVPGLDSMHQTMQKLSEQIAQAKDSLGVLESIRHTADTSFTLQAIKPREFYIVEAQRDTIEAIDGMGDLLQQSIEVQRKQTEQLDTLWQSAAEQARLTRRVLGVAIATAIIGGLAIAVSVVVGLL